MGCFLERLKGAPPRPSCFLLKILSPQMAVMGTRGIQTFSRALRYRNQTVTLPDGSLAVTLVGQEKGVDVRIALDIVRFALDGKYDVALIFSQDQDLSEAVEDVEKISILQNRWIKPWIRKGGEGSPRRQWEGYVTNRFVASPRGMLPSVIGISPGVDGHRSKPIIRRWWGARCFAGWQLLPDVRSAGLFHPQSNIFIPGWNEGG